MVMQKVNQKGNLAKLLRAVNLNYCLPIWHKHVHNVSYQKAEKFAGRFAL